MTSAELATVLALVKRLGTLVNLGHGRDPASVASARAFLDAWDGEIGAVVSWPATAASWLRSACRFAGGAPDAWVIADQARSWTGIGGRLAAMPEWRPGRTVAFAGMAWDGLAGVEGLRGAGADGTEWTILDRSVTWCRNLSGPGTSGRSR
ncbi:hypothetical protein V5P93_006295 [Actinokineospora auranticolor]|uniref:hypothetical protein n=1 Tax=Actinokineospora auranticolor TaxID=155976 RepID=UPI0015E3B7AE|nr:hypothetical protein [Actinokineospora auranticolor]